MNIEAPMVEAIHPVEEYVYFLGRILAEIRRNGAIPIFATTTPYLKGEEIDKVFEPDENGLYASEGKVGEDCDKVVERNKIATAVMDRLNIEVLDLFSFVNGVVEYRSKDGVHYNDTGWDAIAKMISEYIKK